MLEAAPRCFDALHLLGVATLQQGAPAEGAALIRRALAIDPAQATAHANLARALLDLGQYAPALASCNRAVGLSPDLAAAWFSRADALRRLERYAEAVTSYDKALALQPDDAEGWNRLGTVLLRLRELARARECFESALRHAPQYAVAHNNLGLALFELGLGAEAYAAFQRAVALTPNYPEALNNLGNAARLLRRNRDAVDAFERLTACAPQYPYAHGTLLQARLTDADWREFGALSERLRGTVAAGGLAAAPFVFLHACGAAQEQLRCAQLHTAHTVPARPGVALPARAARDRLRVGYVSGDFGEHPVSYLLAGVIEAHDRTRFEPVAISWGRRDETGFRQRIEAAFEHFVDVTDSSDAQMLERVRELELDIAIDLTGHTRGSRTAVFAARAAPVQVNYLGLPATMGAPYIDYLIADRILIPQDHRPYYQEAVVWLPDSFQPQDTQRRAAAVPGRSSLGLPDDALVLCSFNSTAKINPPVFDVWMRILAAAPRAVLWLIADQPTVAANLCREAAQRGIDPARLVFAGRVGYAEHLARYAHADLFLDSWPFNAGATASDALSQGVPVLTCAGDSFASRMAASLLMCLGLDELVTGTPGEYEARAVALLAAPQQLLRLKETLRAQRASHPLFSTDRYRGHLETAYLTMWERHVAGLAPAPFTVAP